MKHSAHVEDFLSIKVIDLELERLNISLNIIFFLIHDEVGAFTAAVSDISLLHLSNILTDWKVRELSHRASEICRDG